MKSPKPLPAIDLQETIGIVPASNEPADQPTSVELERHLERAMNLPQVVSFDTLASNGQEIWIDNLGQMYRLRRTRQGKLILTK